MAKIVVLGSYNIDITVFSDALPRAGETVLGSTLIKSPGGKGSNQAIAASRLGADVTFVAAVGNDDFGDQALDLLEQERVNTNHVIRSESPTGTALIVVDRHGENQIAVASGANEDLTVDALERAYDAIAEADMLLGQLETPLATFLAAARWAREVSTEVLLNPAPFCPLPDEVWKLVDYMTPNQHELAKLARHTDVEAGAKLLQQRGPTAVVVTRGGDGSTVVTSAGATDYPAAQAEAVDTTGAGDAFNAGLAVALAEGKSLEQAVRFGAEVGAYAVTRSGVLDGLPKLADLPSPEQRST